MSKCEQISYQAEAARARMGQAGRSRRERGISRMEDKGEERDDREVPASKRQYFLSDAKSFMSMVAALLSMEPGRLASSECSHNEAWMCHGVCARTLISVCSMLVPARARRRKTWQHVRR
eukprot:749586-Hanusia_phi.AAC.8